MPRERILILGGTREARELASALVAEGYDVITSLAGVTDNPALPEGAVRRGGFGGVEGLVAFLRAERIAVLADATHPFAAQMSRHAAAAAQALRLPLLRLERPPWSADEGARWVEVADAAGAAAALPPRACVLVTTGRRDLSPFLEREDLSGVVRMIEPPATRLPPAWHLVLDRPPHDIAQERELMMRHGISHLVAKNAGGTDTAAKLQAARLLSVRIVMIGRPPKPDAPVFPTVKQFIPAIRRVLLP
jgi:precorrin-6A/cobalt-precorrin-6A reductase